MKVYIKKKNILQKNRNKIFTEYPYLRVHFPAYAVVVGFTNKIKSMKFFRHVMYSQSFALINTDILWNCIFHLRKSGWFMISHYTDYLGVLCLQFTGQNIKYLCNNLVNWNESHIKRNFLFSKIQQNCHFWQIGEDWVRWEHIKE